MNDDDIMRLEYLFRIVESTQFSAGIIKNVAEKEIAHILNLNDTKASNTKG